VNKPTDPPRKTSVQHDGPAREGLGTIDPRTGPTNVGVPRARVDGRAKATGATVFADDLNLPRTLHCRLLRSPWPYARIRGIETARAEAMPGVVKVYTGASFPIPYGILPVSHDEHALCQELARFVGDPVAAVVAETEEQAEDALAGIDVDYEVLPAVHEPEDGFTIDGPPIHERRGPGNVHKAVAFAFGDVEEGFTEADHVFAGDYHFGGNTHLALEQHATVAALDRDGRLTIWSSTQCPHYLHKHTAKVLEMDPALLRVVATPNGGGFGGKSDVFNHEIVVAKAALELGRPVKVCLTREEVFLCHRGRHPIRMHLKTGLSKDGEITGIHLRTLLDGGAYGSYGVASTFYSGSLTTVTYKVPRFRFEACRVHTNKPPCGPKRGHGTVQPRFAQEVQLDEIADVLGKDPTDLRLGMLEEAGRETANWLRLPSIALETCIRNIVEQSDWKARYRQLPHGQGIGFACSSYLSGAGLPINWDKLPQSAVQLRFDRSGLVVAFCGATEIGQGSDDVLAALVGEVLGLRADRIRLVTGDTDLTPVDLGSYSSRVTLMMGNAAVQAAERGRELIAGAVAEKLNVRPSTLVFVDGRIFPADDPDGGVSFAVGVQLAEQIHGTLGTTGSYRPKSPSARFKGGGVGPSPTYSYTAAVARVDVDVDTGFITVPKVWISHDIGRALNPTLAHGQLVGGVYMAVGEALMESQLAREGRPRGEGRYLLRNPSMLDYKHLTHLDMPEVITDLVEEPCPEGPFGAKEIGQGPLTPVIPAIANAVYDAVGVRFREVPISPDKLLAALERQDRGETEVIVGPGPFPDDVPYPEPMDVPPPWEGGDGRERGRGDYAPGVGTKGGRR